MTNKKILNYQYNTLPNLTILSRSYTELDVTLVCDNKQQFQAHKKLNIQEWLEKIQSVSIIRQ